MTPKEQAIHDAIDAIEKALNRALDVTLPKVMAQVFDAGGAEYAASLQRAMKSLSPIDFVGPVGFTEVLPGEAPGTPGKDGRAPRGSVRKAVLAVLLGHPDGLTAPEVVALATGIDPSISTGGIHNELNRQKGKFYNNEDGRWRLIPGVTLGGDYYDLSFRNPRRDRATVPAKECPSPCTQTKEAKHAAAFSLKW